MINPDSKAELLPQLFLPDGSEVKRREVLKSSPLVAYSGAKIIEAAPEALIGLATGPLNWILRRREAGLRGVLAEDGYVYSSPSLWPVAFTRNWFPFHQSQADKWSIPMLDQYVNLYGVLHRESGLGDTNIEAVYANWAEFVRSRNESSDGYCSHAASARILFPQPSAETTSYKGRRIDADAKMALLTMAATSMIPLGYNTGEAIYARVGMFLDGTGRKTFVVNRPKLGEHGGWFVNVDRIRADGYMLGSDDFNLKPYYFAPGLVRDLFEPYLPTDPASMSADIRSQFDYWRPQLQGWILPVNLNLIMDIVYNGQPYALNIGPKEALVYLMRNQQEREQRLSKVNLATQPRSLLMVA